MKRSECGFPLYPNTQQRVREQASVRRWGEEMEKTENQSNVVEGGSGGREGRNDKREISGTALYVSVSYGEETADGKTGRKRKKKKKT